jgi:hypothetical protein
MAERSYSMVKDIDRAGTEAPRRIAQCNRTDKRGRLTLRSFRLY